MEVGSINQGFIVFVVLAIHAIHAIGLIHQTSSLSMLIRMDTHYTHPPLQGTSR
jgi:hypothetical protein